MSCWFLEYYCGLDQQLPAITFKKQIDYKKKEISNLVFQPEFCQPFNCFLYEFYPEVEVCDGQNIMTAVFDYHAISLFRRDYNHYIFTSMRDRMIQVTKYNLFIDTSDSTKVLNSYLNLTLKLQILEFKPVKDQNIPKKIIDQAEQLFQEQRIKERIANFRHWFYRSLLRNGASSIQAVTEHQQSKKNNDLEIMDEGDMQLNLFNLPTLSQVFDEQKESIKEIKQNKPGEKNNQELILNFGAIIQKTQVFRLKPDDFLKKECQAVKAQTKQSRLSNKDQNCFQVVNQPQKQCGLSLNTEEQLFQIFGVLPEFRDICPFAEITEFDEQISKRREILVPKASIYEIDRLIIQEKGETFYLEKKAAKIKKLGDLVEETKRRQQLALKCQHYQLYQNTNNQQNINQKEEDKGLKQTLQPTRKIIGYEFQLSRSYLKEKILKILNTDDNEKIDVTNHFKKQEAKRSQSAQIQKSTMNIRPRANSQENILQLRDVEENHDDRSLNQTITDDGKSQKSHKRVLRREFKKEALSQITPQPNLINDETQSEEDSLDQQINNNIDTPSLLIDRPIEDIILMPSHKNHLNNFSCMNQQLFQSYMEWLTGDSITSFPQIQNNQDCPSEQEKIEQILDRRFFVAKKTWFDNYQEEKNKQQIKNEQEFLMNENKDGDDVEMKDEDKIVERRVANHKYTTRSKQELPTQEKKSTMNNSLKAQDTQSNIEDDYAEKQDSLVKNRRGKKPKQIEMKQIHPEKLQQKKEENIKLDLKDEQNDESLIFSKMDDESHPLLQSQINITSSIKVAPTFTKSKDVYESPKKEQINQNQENQEMKEYPKTNSVEKQTKKEIKIVYRPPFEDKQIKMEGFSFNEPKPILEKDLKQMTPDEKAIYKQSCKIYNLKFEMAKTAYQSKKNKFLLLIKQQKQAQQNEITLMAETEKETKEYLLSEVQDEDADWAEVMPEEKPIEDEESRYLKQKQARKFRQKIVRKMLDKCDLIDQHLAGLHAKKQSILTIDQKYQENKSRNIQQNKKIDGSFGVQLSESTPISNTDSIMGSIHSNYINSKSVQQMSVEQSPKFKAPIEESEEEQFQEEILQSEEEQIAQQPEEEMEVQDQPYGDEIDLTYQSSVDEDIHENQEYDQEEEDDDQQDDYYQMQKHKGRSNDFVNIKHQLKNREEIERQRNIGNFRQPRDRREHEIYNSKLERSSKIYPIKEERYDRRKEYIQQKNDIILSPKHKKKIQSPKSPKVDMKASLPIGGVALPNPEMLKKIKNDPDTMMNMMLQMYQAVQQLTSGQKQAAAPPRNRHRNGQSRKRHYRDEYDQDQSCSEFIVSDDPDAEQYSENITHDSFGGEGGFPPDQEDSVEEIEEDDEIDDKDYLLPTFSQGEASQMNHEEDFEDVQDIRYTSSEKKRNRQIRSKSPENVTSYKVRLNEPVVAPFSDNEVGSFGTESQVNEEECEEDYSRHNRHKSYYHHNRVATKYDQQRYQQEKYMSHSGLKRSSSSYHEPWRHQKGYHDEKRYLREEDEEYEQHLDLDEIRHHHKSRKYYQQNQIPYNIHKEEEPIRKRRRTEIEEEQKFQSEDDLMKPKYKNLKEFAQQAVLETTFKAVTSMVSEKHRDRQNQMKHQSRKSRMYNEEHSLSEGGNTRRYYDENKRVDKSHRKHEEQILRYQSAKPINGTKRIEHPRRS